MVGIYDLDVSMTLDDLAWHFGNHNDERFLQETVASLMELEAKDAAALFSAAWDICSPICLKSETRIGIPRTLTIT